MTKSENSWKFINGLKKVSLVASIEDLIVQFSVDIEVSFISLVPMSRRFMLVILIEA